jgi:hypothetical protein
MKIRAAAVVLMVGAGLGLGLLALSDYTRFEVFMSYLGFWLG